MGDRDRPTSAGCTKRDGTVHLQGLQGGRRGVGVVRSLAIGLEKKDLVAIVDGGASNVGIDSTGGCLVLQFKVESGARHSRRRDGSI